MSDDISKLKRGVALLARAGSDRALLGAALLAIHAAMRAALFDALNGSTTLSTYERQQLAGEAPEMRVLVTLAERHLGLSREEGSAVLEAERERVRLANGEAFTGASERLLRYARFAESFCGVPGLLGEALAEARHARARTAPRPLPHTEAPRPWWQLSAWAWAQIVSFFVIIGVLGGGAWWLYRQLDVPRLVGSLGAPPPAVARPTLAVPTTTAQRAARIVRVGVGPGWLHDSPDFGSPTLPVPLRDDMRATLLDQQAIGADGTVWLRVAVSGYEGWCPAQNLEPEA